MTRPEDRLDRVRRNEIMLAGWEGDTALRAVLGSYEQATWEIGACARDPERVHAYGGSRDGKRHHEGWQDRIDAFRKQMEGK